MNKIIIFVFAIWLCFCAGISYYGKTADFHVIAIGQVREYIHEGRTAKIKVCGALHKVQSGYHNSSENVGIGNAVTIYQLGEKSYVDLGCRNENIRNTWGYANILNSFKFFGILILFLMIAKALKRRYS